MTTTADGMATALASKGRSCVKSEGPFCSVCGYRYDASRECLGYNPNREAPRATPPEHAGLREALVRVLREADARPNHGSMVKLCAVLGINTGSTQCEIADALLARVAPQGETRHVELTECDKAGACTAPTICEGDCVYRRATPSEAVAWVVVDSHGTQMREPRQTPEQAKADLDALNSLEERFKVGKHYTIRALAFATPPAAETGEVIGAALRRIPPVHTSEDVEEAMKWLADALLARVAPQGETNWKAAAIELGLALDLHIGGEGDRIIAKHVATPPAAETGEPSDDVGAGWEDDGTLTLDNAHVDRVLVTMLDNNRAKRHWKDDDIVEAIHRGALIVRREAAAPAPREVSEAEGFRWPVFDTPEYAAGYDVGPEEESAASFWAHRWQELARAIHDQRLAARAALSAETGTP